MKKISINLIEKIILTITIIMIFLFNYSEISILIVLTNLFILTFIFIEIIQILKNKVLKCSKGLLPYLVFLTFCFLSLFGAYNIDDSLEKIKTLITLLLFLVSLVNFIQKDDNNIKFFLSLVSKVTVLASVYILINFDWSNRATGIIGDCNQVAAYMSYGLTILILGYKERIVSKYWFIFGLPLILFVNILSGSRSGLIVSVLGVVLFLFNSNRKGNFNKKNVIKNLMTIIICITIVSFIYEQIMTNETLYKLIGSRYTSFFEIMSGKKSSINETSTTTRLFMLNLAWERFTLNIKTFFLGNGIGFFASYFETQPGGWNAFCHNNYLELLSGIGILGAISYYYIYFKYIKKYIRSSKNNYNRAGMIIIIQMLLMHLFVVFYYQKCEYIFISIIIYLLYIRKENINEEKKQV